MGYESTIYLVEKHIDFKNDNGKSWAQVVAMYDLCSMGYHSEFNKLFASKDVIESRDSNCFIYIGNKEVSEDCYGSPLTEATIDETIVALETDFDPNDSYRRIPPLLGMLKAIDQSLWKNLVVLHYGH